MSDNITLVGNVVGDPEQRTTRSGDTIAAFRLAVSERRFDRDKAQWVDGHTNFFSVSVFGELGRHALSSFRKGERVIVMGRLKLREWETEAKRGVSADVAAEAIGHDLRWGVSHFERTPRPEPARVAAAARAAGDGDAWAVPGQTVEGTAAGQGRSDAGAEVVDRRADDEVSTSSESSSSTADERPPAAVGVGDGTTPF